MTRLTGPRRDELARSFERLFDEGSAVGCSDAQLLDRFVQRRDESAFAAIVERHGPMVLGVCRRFLRDPNDVDDAFQAVFLVLARKAGGLRSRDLLGNWLFGVACRVAARARIAGVRRGEKLVTDGGDRLDVDPRRPEAPDPVDAMAHREEWVLLHEEVRRLPHRYRSTVVACYFEGRTHEEAAARLRCPVGTVKGRLSRARDLLRRRLESRGATATAGALSTALASTELRAAVPIPLAADAVRHALAVSASPSAAWMTTPAISLSVRTLTEGALQAMFYSQIKTLALPALTLSAGLLAAGASLAYSPQDGADRPTAEAPAAPVADPQTEEAEMVDDQPKPEPEEEAKTEAEDEPKPAKQSQSGGFGGGGGGGMSGPSPEEIRQNIAGLAASVAKYDQASADAQLGEALALPFTLKSDEDSTLRDMLDLIKQSVKIADGKRLPVYVDPVGLRDADAALDSSVTIDLEDVPLKFSLRLMLKQLGLAYCIRDGVLIISSLEGVQQELLEVQKELMARYPEKVIVGPGGAYFDGVAVPRGTGGIGVMGGMGGGMR
ncbi:RNA polymerase sigma factor [Paludisphaera soli]|uniref:RNA polymerase sigma factor n=1 Tax=Paludisphaera soli TaxID=2712865 RepID=UPI0013EC299C|nr:RNA polymerase sigma factor [Paludisphaera soli]